MAVSNSNCFNQLALGLRSFAKPTLALKRTELTVLSYLAIELINADSYIIFEATSGVYIMLRLKNTNISTTGHVYTCTV